MIIICYINLLYNIYYIMTDCQRQTKVMITGVSTWLTQFQWQYQLSTQYLSVLYYCVVNVCSIVYPLFDNYSCTYSCL